jgi:hypothetical protein
MLFSENTIITGVYPAHLNKLVFHLAEADGQTFTFPIASTLESRPDGSFVTFAVLIEVTTAQDVQSTVVDLNTGIVIAIILGTLPAGVQTATT